MWVYTHDGQEYIVSNIAKDISHGFVQSAFGTSAMDWANPLAPEDFQTMLDNSCVFGLLRKTSDSSSSTTQIGIARLITDYVTLAYVTDVYIDPEYQGRGLACFMMSCCRDVIGAMPAVRGTMLCTSRDALIPFYERELGVRVHPQGENGFSILITPRNH
ncbi:hypothetical protein BDY21DRAFT_292407 [Lineolata rhizophorae]|uniref:N-acetyltransferase domain-containing protein n=1 Tax=Lineolata rhizophorae TaxID=578093 RepID=A0A6A6NQQ9_9PEZI|nr:hypothetical protein BDY21DRAFT_292407 [Lineolata rhizophorae]